MPAAAEILKPVFGVTALCALLVLGACEWPSGNKLTPAQRAEALARTASSVARPEYPREGRLAPFGDTACFIRRARKVAVDGRAYVLTAVYASERRDCQGDGQVLLTLWGDPSEQGWAQLAQTGGAASSFGFRFRLHPINEVGFALPPREAEDERRVDLPLRDLMSADPVPAGALPVWPQDALAPVLPDDLEFEPATDLATYETVRALNLPALCWKPDDIRLRCIAHAPRRRPDQIELFTVHGFNDFRRTDARAALAAVLGQGKSQDKW